MNMKTLLTLIFAALTSVVTLGADENAARQVADSVVKASGGDVWPRVKTIDFTFNVGQGEKQLSSVQHHWDLQAQTDTVTWGGKTVTVNLRAPGSDADAKAAFQRWTNDSYWLLAPLKLRDPGVHLADKGDQQVEGKTYRVLEVSFESVGLTPKDKYNLYIDLEAVLVARWDYMPSPEKKMSATWEGYQDFNGL